MDEWLQWAITVAVILLFYFGYVHGAIKSCRIEKVQVGMTEKQVRKILGRPARKTTRGSNTVYRYKIWYLNRLAPETVISVHVEFSKGKVTNIRHKKQ